MIIGVKLESQCKLDVMIMFPKKVGFPQMDQQYGTEGVVYKWTTPFGVFLFLKLCNYSNFFIDKILLENCFRFFIFNFKIFW